MLFSDWQPITQALQPVHVFRSTAMPHLWPVYSHSFQSEISGGLWMPRWSTKCGSFVYCSNVPSRARPGTRFWISAAPTLSMAKWSCVQASLYWRPVLRSFRPSPRCRASHVRSL